MPQTRSRKHQLDAAAQGVSATSGSINEEPSVLDIDQQLQFNEDLMMKLFTMKPNVSPTVQNELKGALNMLKERNKTLKAERDKQTKPYTACAVPQNVQAMVLNHLPDKDLIRMILKSQCDAAAGEVLRKRNIRLQTLAIQYYPTHVAVGVISRSCDAKDEEYTNSNWNMRLREFSYCCPVAALPNLVTKLRMEAFFGPPPAYHDSKVKIGTLRIYIPELLPIVNWFCPTLLDIIHPSEEMFDIDGQLMVTGAEAVDLKWSFTRPDYVDNVNRFMQATRAKTIRLGYYTNWSHLSILRVIEEHASSGDQGVPRKIEILSESSPSRELREWEISD